MAEKKWVNLEDFCDALAAAREYHVKNQQHSGTRSVAKADVIIGHLSRTLNATRGELKALVGIASDREFDALIAEAVQGRSGLRVENAGTYAEWYYLRRTEADGNRNN
jgi:hypothetical protein